jgi:hypothetical protein
MAFMFLLPLLGVTLVLSGACVVGGSRVRRWAGVGVALSSMLLPWGMPPGYPLTRGVFALILTIGCMRVGDLRRGQWSLARRLRHVVSVVDSRRLVPGPPRLLGRNLVSGLLWLALALLGYRGLELRLGEGPVFWVVRWGTCGVLTYSAVSAGYALWEAAYVAFGLATQTLHRAPILSRSVQELWGERWALPVTAWLGETFFRPFARRRRPVLGALLAFTASAAFHAYAVWVALGFEEGATMAGLMFAYFVVQAGVMGIERTVGVRSWVPWAGHVWTVSMMVVTAPLFLEPCARVLVQTSR